MTGTFLDVVTHIQPVSGTSAQPGSTSLTQMDSYREGPIDSIEKDGVRDKGVTATHGTLAIIHSQGALMEMRRLSDRRFGTVTNQKFHVDAEHLLRILLFSISIAD